MQSIQAHNYKVDFGKTAYQSLNAHIQRCNYSKIFVLTDTNTNHHCTPRLLPLLETDCTLEIIEMEAGEPYKNLDTCSQVWQAMADLSADRKSLLINLGGGVVTDLGGFVASTYQRGIDFINIPTSLLAMVDASVGGKTGVDLGALKNQIGVINNPLQVLIDIEYLSTLPSEELRSGMAEMFKHGLIRSEPYWNQMQELNALDITDLQQLIYDSVVIKNEVVTQDPKEKGLRKTLNYGHTLGHAIESYCLEQSHRSRLLHGQAIAIGMILSSYISSELLNFPIEKVQKIKKVLLSYFKKQKFSKQEITDIMSLMKFDKKNSHGNINFVLLEDIAQPKIDCQVSEELIYKAFDFYIQD